MLTISTTLLLAFAPAPTIPAPSVTAPKGPAPGIQFFVFNDKKELTRSAPVMEVVPITFTEIRNFNGKELVVPSTKYETRVRHIQSVLTLDTVTFYDLAGKEIRKDDLPKLLKGGAMVVVSSDGKPVDPEYMKLFKEGTLTAIFKQNQPIPLTVAPPVPLPK